MNKRKKKALIFLIILAIIIIISALCLVEAKNGMVVKYLSKSKRVDAEVLLVEGWMQPASLKLAYDEFVFFQYKQLVTTGLNAPEYFNMSMDGFLIFYPGDKLKTIPDNVNRHTISIRAYGELGMESASHLQIWVNDEVVEKYYAIQEPILYSHTWKGKLADINNIIVQFDNDEIGLYGDRNLYVKEVVIDDTISIPYQYNTVYDMGAYDGQNMTYNNYVSLAEQARSIIVSFGADPRKVIAIPGEKEIINRTLTSALAFKKWFDAAEDKPKSINIVSQGVHARRTQMIFKSVLNRDIPVGIISIDDEDTFASIKQRYIKVARELIALCYYKIVLMFY